MGLPGYFLEAPGSVVLLPVAPRWGDPVDGVEQLDLMHESDAGTRYVYTLGSRAVHHFQFRFTRAQKAAFLAMHNAVNGQDTPFFFVPDTDDMDTFIYCRKERDFRPRELPMGAVVDGVETSLFDYQLELTGEPLTEDFDTDQVDSPEWHVFGQIFLESATQNLAVRPWNVTDTSGEEIYEGLVLGWGNIDRSVPFPAGMPQVGDARIRIADTTRRLRDRLAHETPRRRTVTLKIAQRGGSSLFSRPAAYTGEIVDAVFGSGYVEFNLRDVTFAWLDEVFPDLITHDTFPELSIGVDSAFANIITGVVTSHEKNPQGAVPIPHIGFSSAAGDWFGIACHPIWDLVALYRKLPGEGAFTLVDEAEFTIIEETRDALGLNLTFSILVFPVEQPAGTELRADVEGISSRGGWGPLAPVTGLLRNPVDFFINMTYFFLVRAGLDPVTPFDTEEIEFLREQCESLIPDSSTDGAAPLLCDGALVKPFSAREFFGKFLPSFQFSMFQKKNGLITLRLIGESDSNRIVFNRGKIIRNTFVETIARPTYNQVAYRTKVNYTTNEWGETTTYDNEDDQRALGEYTGEIDTAGPVRSVKIERDPGFDFWFVRDNATAAWSIARRMSYLALGSYRQQFKMPLPEVIDDIDLADLIGISHPFGLEEDGGYSDKEVVVTALTADLDRLTLDVKTILREPQSIEIPETILRRTALLTGGPGFADSAGESGLRFRTVGPYIGPTRWTHRGGVAGGSDDFGTDKEGGRIAIVNGLTTTFGQDWVLFVGTASSTGDAELWYWKDVTKTWEKLFGDGVNGGWGAGQYESVTALFASGNGSLYIGLGSDTADGEVWKYSPRLGKYYIEKIGDAGLNGFPSNNQVVLDFCDGPMLMAAMGQQGVSGAALWGFNGSEWTEFGGPTAEGEDFGSGHFTVNGVTTVGMDAFLYVGLGNGGVFGDEGGQVWRNGGFTWGKVLGNGDQPAPTFNPESVQFVRDFEGGLVIGVGLQVIGGGELWHWDGTTATKIGGDGVQGSWASKRQCKCIYVDGHDMYVGVGSATGIDQNNAEVWKYTGPGIHGFWTKLGGQGLDGSWNDLEYNTIGAITKYGNSLWVITAGNSGAGEAWRYAL